MISLEQDFSGIESVSEQQQLAIEADARAFAIEQAQKKLQALWTRGSHSQEKKDVN